MKKVSKIFVIVLVFYITLQYSFPLHADSTEQQIVRFGVNSGRLAKFPNNSGIRWTDNIAYRIFTDHGEKIEVIGYPEKRLGLALAQGNIDIFVSSDAFFGQFENQVIATKYPYSVLIWFIYYNTHDGWTPTWPPDDVFLNKAGKSFQSSSSLSELFNLNITQAPSYDASFKMVNMGRADYWIDNMAGIRAVSPKLLKQKDKGYTYQTIFRRGVYFFFQNSIRGRALRDKLDSGFEKTLREGLFVKLFYENDNSHTNTITADETILLLREEFPNLYIPEQQSP